MNYSLDIGQNLFSLGLLFLVLKYVLPFLFILIVIGGLFLFLRAFILPTISPKNFALIVIAALLLVAVSVAAY